MKPTAPPTYRFPERSRTSARQRHSIVRILALLLCVTLSVAGLTPCRTSDPKNSECRDVMEIFQIPCFVGCAITSPEPTPVLAQLSESCCLEDFTNGGAGNLPEESCLCCSNSPLKKTILKARTTTVQPPQHSPMHLMAGLFHPAGDTKFQKTPPARTVSLSDHLPLRSTIVIIV
ncbi:MAG: hypothetical protein V1793_15905 [Pseudomonadota bacterium]